MMALGLWTRPLAFLLAGQMAVAHWWGHWWAHPERSFFSMVNHGEGTLLYCFVFLYLAAAVGGGWSVDAALAGRGKQANS